MSNFVSEEEKYNKFGGGLAGSVSQPPQLESIANELKREYNNMAMRQSVRDRIVSQVQHAQQESNKLQKLNRLIALLDKHPEVFEILDLLDSLDLR